MAHAEGNAESHEHHIIPFKILLSVFLALVGLTVLTVAVAQVHLGPLNVPVALGIASAKAALVVMFFMALKYDKPVNTMVFALGTVFVVVFIAFTLFDTAYRGDLGNVGAQTITEEEAQMEQLRQREPDPDQLRMTPADLPNQSDTTAGDTTNNEAQ